jgi:hypothetical protein
MGKKSITIDVDSAILKNLHIWAIENDVSRKAFIEKCVEVVGKSNELLVRVQEEIKKESPAD